MLNLLNLRNSAVVLSLSALTLSVTTPVLAQSLIPRPLTETAPLPTHRGTADDLRGIRPRNSLIWFGGVGGGDDEEVEESVYEIRQPRGSLPLFDPDRVPIHWDTNSGEPQADSFLIPLSQF
ncbi:MAG: hypothetical protein VKJ02_15900 [Snowella sp.]|nr:hypothetical protein [Snowella sp.]